MSCKWHSPPSSHTGQSWGWFSIRPSIMDARNSATSASSIEMRVPSTAGVIQAITILPRVSLASLNCLTAHWRQAPTEPIAGCQQKYGRVMPNDREACSRVCVGVILAGLLSTYTVAMSSPRAALLTDVPLEIGAEVFQRAL